MCCRGNPNVVNPYCEIFKIQRWRTSSLRRLVAFHVTFLFGKGYGSLHRSLIDWWWSLAYSHSEFLKNHSSEEIFQRRQLRQLHTTTSQPSPTCLTTRKSRSRPSLATRFCPRRSLLRLVQSSWYAIPPRSISDNFSPRNAQ